MGATAWTEERIAGTSEIMVKGPQVFKGTGRWSRHQGGFSETASSKKATSDGSREGFLIITDRKKTCS